MTKTTGNFLRNQPTRKRSVPLLPPSSDCRWSHRICVIPNSAVTPEIQICIVTEQKCAERLHLFNVFNKSVVKILQGVPQNKRRLLTG